MPETNEEFDKKESYISRRVGAMETYLNAAHESDVGVEGIFDMLDDYFQRNDTLLCQSCRHILVLEGNFQSDCMCGNKLYDQDSDQ